MTNNERAVMMIVVVTVKVDGKSGVFLSGSLMQRISPTPHPHIFKQPQQPFGVRTTDNVTYHAPAPAPAPTHVSSGVKVLKLLLSPDASIPIHINLISSPPPAPITPSFDNPFA